ncbi:MAG TPA: FkbM family methyltransferase [Gemmatimonadales bacterium]|nr:FkbM family methyltransferase [Gemmatimonadales bacterium]
MTRLLTHPWKELYPKLLYKLGLSHAVSTKTFWNGRFEVVLPEGTSTHVWRYGFFESDVCTFLLRFLRPGMVFVDVGAHYGFFTLLASNLVSAEGRVMALEPIPRTFRQLNKNASSNSRFRNIIPVNVAAYSANTTLQFRDYGLVDSAMNSAFGQRNRSGERGELGAVNVSARTCDDLVTALGVERVDFMKIDAESAEMHVLRGAERLIRESAPLIVLEVGDFDLPGVARSRDLVEWLSQRGYVAHECVQGEILRHQSRDRYEPGNLLFRHTA